MDKALKQRLVGAVVLIALAVIVLPMIFGGRPGGGPGPSEITLPAEPPDLEFETRRFPIGDQPRPEPDDATPAQLQSPLTSQPQDQTQPEVPEESPNAAELQPENAVASEAVETEEPAADEAPSGGNADEGVETEDPIGDLVMAQASRTEDPPAVTANLPEDDDALRYVVQVASFGSTQNATRLAGQLEEAGYAVLLDHVSSDTAQLNRVRVGPYGSEAAAQAVARELRDRFSGINPRIVDLEPEKTSPVVASHDPLVRWVVQVGSFGSRENASNLVSRLKATGLSAFDEAVTTDTSTIYRVRVGPYLDRDEALRVERRIGSEMGIDGVVMSAD